MRGIFGRFMKCTLIRRNAVPLLRQAAKAVDKEANSVIDFLKTKDEHALSGKGIQRSSSMKKIII